MWPNRPFRDDVLNNSSPVSNVLHLDILILFIARRRRDTMTSRVPSLRVRINQIDYTVEPTGPLDNTTIPEVPIIRIYGESSIGRKACLHIHQVYPYFFIEYAGIMSPDNGELNHSTGYRSSSRRLPVNKYLSKLSHSLNHAIALSLKRDPNSSNSQFVRAVILVKGVHFYGFHTSYAPFLKIHIADPALVNRAVTLMRSGTVMKTCFPVYESHLSYPLQFMSDFGLYGCGWIELGDIWIRGQDNEEGENQQLIGQTSPYYCQTRMPLELDVAAHQILNRHRLSARNFNHQLNIPAPPLPDEPVVLSVRELWEDERRRRMERGLSPSPPMPKVPSEQSRGAGGGWSAEIRYWEEFRKRLEKEQVQDAKQTQEQSWERWVMTTFESVEALWEDEYRVWRPRRRTPDAQKREFNLSQDQQENPYEVPATGRLGRHHTTKPLDDNVDVDEHMLSSQELSVLVEYEEQEWAQRQEAIIERDDVAEAERAAEEGLPLEQEYGENTPVKARNPPRR